MPKRKKTQGTVASGSGDGAAKSQQSGSTKRTKLLAKTKNNQHPEPISTVQNGNGKKSGSDSSISQSKRAKGREKSVKQTVINRASGSIATNENADGNLPAGESFVGKTPSETLARLVAPLDGELFLVDKWEREPVILTKNRERNCDFFKLLFTREILEEIVATKKISFAQDCNVCRYRDGRRESLNGKGLVKPKQLKDLLDKSKATIQFHQPQRFQNSIWQLMEHLETYFNCLVGSNVYMTPRGSQGLAPHYDDVEVFILQLEGRKRWRLYKPLTELPRDYSGDFDQSDIGEPTHDITLEAGDVMYFPRGTIHQAETPDSCSHSTHLTISTYQRNSWADLVGHALPSILQSAITDMKDLREGLPLVSRSGEISCEETVRRLVNQLGDHVTIHHIEDARNEMERDFIANRLPPFSSGPLDLGPSGPMPTVNHEVRFRFPGHFCIISEREHKDVNENDVEDDDDDDIDDEDDAEDGVGDPRLFVYHSLGNSRVEHMMASEPPRPQGIRLHFRCEDALRRIKRSGAKWTTVKDIEKNADLMEEGMCLQMLTSLWVEGLLEVREIGKT